MMRDPLWSDLAQTTDEGATNYLALDRQYEEAAADIHYGVQYRTTVEDLTMPPMNLGMTATTPGIPLEREEENYALR
jgi:hypothetical protein